MNLRARLKDGAPLVGTFLGVPAPEMVEVLALAGFDAVVIDCEHGPFSEHAIAPMILAARSHGVHALVRVRTDDPSLIGVALDQGADGVLVPQIDSAAAAARAIDAARFAPTGRRGVNPYVRAAGFTGDRTWASRADGSSAVLLMVEGPAGIAALPEILELPGLDGVMVGPVDLSHALGRPGQLEHPDVVSAATRIIADTASAGLSSAIFAPTVELGRRWLDLGVTLLLYSVDTALVHEGCTTALRALRPDRAQPATRPASGGG